jgi:hypothetical protein
MGAHATLTPRPCNPVTQVHATPTPKPCHPVTQVHDLIHKAGLEGAQTEGRGEALTAIAYLCDEV